MAQFDFGTIDPSNKSGTQLASDLNSWRDAVLSCHKGSSRPSYVKAGMLWIKDATAVWEMYLHDGTDDILLGYFNTTTNGFAFSAAGDSYISAGGKLVFEGSTDDAFEVTLDPGDPTADRTITLPNKSGTVLLDTDIDPAVAAKTNAVQTWTATQVPDNGTASVTAGSTYNFDGADQVREITLTGAGVVTFGAPTGIQQNAMYKLKLKAGDTSSRTFAWNAAFKFPSASAPLTAGSTTTGAKDTITFIGGPSNTLEYEGHNADLR